MRYDTPVFFVCKGKAEYDTTTGDYTRGESTREKKMASVMDTTEKTLLLVYGEIRQGSLTVQLQNHYSEPFDYIEIGGGRYSVDYNRRSKLGQKQVFVVSEVQ